MTDETTSNLLFVLADAPCQMLSRRAIFARGFSESDIKEHEARGEILVTGAEMIASVFITGPGMAAIDYRVHNPPGPAGNEVTSARKDAPF